MVKEENYLKMSKDLSKIIGQLVDFLMPELSPYGVSLYLFLLRNSFIGNNSSTIRIGKRTIADKFVKAARGERSNYAHITKVLKELEKTGCIKVGDVDRNDLPPNKWTQRRVGVSIATGS